MQLKSLFVVGIIVVGGLLVYRDVGNRIGAAEAGKQRNLREARNAEISRCEIKAKNLRALIGGDPDFDDYAKGGMIVLERIRGWSEQAKTNMPPDLFDVARDFDRELRKYGQNATVREKRKADLESVEAYISRLRNGAPPQIGICL